MAWASEGITRRGLLKAGTAAGLGLGLPGGLWREAAAAEKRTLIFTGWVYEPELVRQNLDRFEKIYPEYKVDYTPTDTRLYREKLVAMFQAGTPLDALYVRDDYFSGWVEAGYLQPIDGMPGLKDLDKDMFDFNLDAMTHKGKRYGIPYYADYMVFLYNKKMLAEAGFAAPPKTLDELRRQAEAIKKQRLAEYPLLTAFGTTAGFFFDWWGFVYGSSGRLFDKEWAPTFPDKDKTALNVLEWLVAAIHDWKIMDIKIVEMVLENVGTKEAFAQGQAAFVSQFKYNTEWLNNPKFSKIAGQAKPTPYPSLSAGQKGTMGWTRQYCITTSTKKRDDAWKLISYLGGKDEKGQYYTAKNWYLLRGLGFAYKPLWQDKDIIEATNKWGDAKVFSEMALAAKARENIKAPWFSEWDSFNQARLQEALLKKTKPRDALAASAKKAEDLRKEWKG